MRRARVPAFRLSQQGSSSASGWSSPQTAPSRSRRRFGSRRSRSGSRPRSRRSSSTSTRRSRAARARGDSSRTQPICGRARGHCSPRRAAGSGRTRTPATCSPARRVRRRRARPSRTRCSSCCSTLSGSSRRASKNRRTRPAGTSRRERRVSGPPPRSRTRSRGARPAGSGRPWAICFGSRRTRSAARGRCPLPSLRRCRSRKPQPSGPATASAVGAERSPAAAPRSTTRDRWAATSRFS